MRFSFKLEEDKGIAVIYLMGDLMERSDATELIAKIDELIDLNRNTFVLNLSELKYMNSTGLNLLISILSKARNHGGEVLITEVSAKIKELLVVTKLNTVFTITDTNKKAIEMIEKRL
ncbi:MAG: STAS domain-containing protein [Bacteroidia bacterium]|nr:STAS domain-containing protein [Bacteroidia bacterium]